ncbi:MAG TPA: ABC transporter substrate-binding protein [Solirubrobacteraceae bacterium]|nr:ABC transporter substrate-binding protein [Solirubrobacteraceae bacterium]
MAVGCVLAVIAAGCGSGGSGDSTSGTSRPSRAPVRSATLILDFTPNAVHAGVYAALARHYDRAEGVHLHVIAPTASTDSIKLLETGRVNFAILDIHDLAIARERHEDVVGIMAIVERPLSAVVAAPGIGSPRQLQGKTVGITGVPSDTAVLHSVVAGSGGDPAKVKTITIGFNAVADLLAGRVAAATAFWNDEGLTVQSRRPGFHVFRVDEYGAPSYPELVLCATGRTVRRDRGLAQHVVAALARGYRFALAHPAASARDLEHMVPGLDPKLVSTQLGALLPAFAGPDRHVGELDPARLRAWATWEARFGIVAHAPDVARALDPRLAARAKVPTPASAS